MGSSRDNSPTPGAAPPGAAPPGTDPSVAAPRPATPLYPASAFDFALPPAAIAQSPGDRRDASRLMIVERETGVIRHGRFGDLAGLVLTGDALVRNTSRVIRARLLGTRDSGAPAEVMLLRPLGDGGEGGGAAARRWEAMVHPGGKLRPGRVVHVAPGFDVQILETTPRRTRIVELRSSEDPLVAIERHGHIPLPPYIARPDAPDDAERYQTVYAREPGSVAAPTAGLHFTPELLAALQAQGVRVVDVVLHVGAGTFKPVEHDDLSRHVMHEEWYTVTEGAAAALNATRDAGGRIWGVGTTSVRTLESNVTDDGRFRAEARETSIFIHPPYTWRAVDRIITNFHLPRSTLLMLVAAFAGYELTMEAYRVAVRDGYRFYSYGDAMVIL